MNLGARAIPTSTLAVGLGLSLFIAGAPRPAEACGGTFCDAGPTAMPVDQTGETILFVVDDGHVEAHIQIQYDPETEAEQFAWLVPVTALPEFSVGSQQLFANILQGTVPAFGMSNWNESCGFEDEGGGWDGCDGGGDESGDGGVSEKLDIGGGEPEAPEVVLATTVGAFEVFVIDGGTVQGVMTWLGDNGFTQDAAAEPILAEYLAEGHMFAAFRLSSRSEAAEIHPITLRFEGDEPCVPIRLTRIAAQDDMEIRALFLGDSRVASSNYRHVTLNPLKFEWNGLEIGYRDVVTRAVDEPGADGHAFVTEYAGTSEVVMRDDLLGPLWNTMAFELAMTPTEAVLQLLDQQLVGFVPELGQCGAQHPLIEGLIARYLVTPEDLSLESMCSDPEGWAAQVDPMSWDPAAFAADFQERIVDPGLHANELLDTWPVVTRLYTTLSPHEMTEDPMFHPTPELPEVTGLTQVINRNSFCDGHLSYGLPDGRLVAATGSATWPDIAPEQMPWAESIEYLPAKGAPVVEVDNRELIESLLDAWNEENGPPRSPTSASCHGEDTGSVTVGGTGGTATGGADVEGVGCGCRGTGAGPSGWLALLGLLGLRLRRRRR